MKGSVIDWYIRKYWGEDYIRKSEVKDLLVRAKHNESERLYELFSQEKKDLREYYESERRAEVTELQAQIDRLNYSLKEADRRVKQAQQVFFKSITRAKQTARTSADIDFQMTRLMEVVAEITGQFKGIESRASEDLQRIEADVAQDRCMLGLPEVFNE